jgi:Carboxypeptidase regulatory-like domain/TonB dependent receptor
MRSLSCILLCSLVLSSPSAAAAQVQTGSIVGAVTDSSNAVMPGVLVSLSGERLIGGVQTFTTDATGAYRFDRLPPGDYTVKFELQGFRTVERAAIRVNAAFVATVNIKLEVGSVAETITVTGESPTIDTRSTLQQTVMNQEVLEGVPTGRDPWSLAKLIPGVQVATYDVGGTQSIQQSSLSSHGSNTNDVSYNIDGATVNWPGGGGGATMLYYDQGMFEEVNYMTSAIPAEVLVGGVSINMVTKVGGNQWRGNLRYSFANDDLQSENHTDLQQTYPTLLGNPTQETYDFNLSGGGALIQNRLWVNGTVRRWVVDKLTNAKNFDGSQALDDNTLKNYSGKVVASLSANQKLQFSYLWNDKIRGHRRDGTLRLPDIASVVQTNPASTTQAKYTAIRNTVVFESNFSVMDGQTNYTYQPGTPPDAIRMEDADAGIGDFAADREDHQPNARLQFDNVVSYSKNDWGGEHLFKGGVQFARLTYDSDYNVQGDHYVEFSNGAPLRVRQFNTPNLFKNEARVLGLFLQDAWTVASRLTLNLGMRFDRYVGILPAQSNPAGQFAPARDIPRSEPIKQNIGVWRTGAAYDLFGNGETALKASYSRYALQVGIDRVTAVNPLATGNRTCPWNDANGDRRFQADEITAACSGFSGGVNTFYADGVDWPYSDEVTAGVEHQLMRDMRVGVMYYYRTNKKQFGIRNTAVPTSAYTPFSIPIPANSLGVSSVTVYNLASSLASAQNFIRDNEEFLDTKYQGVEFTASKRFSNRWQMVGGLTVGKNTGGLNTPTGTSGQQQNTTGDLNDPNNIIFSEGTIGNDSEVAFRLSGSYRLPWDVSLSGSVVSNTGYPVVTTYNVTRAYAATFGQTLTRSGQNVPLTPRGEERLENVTMVDLRVSRPISMGRIRFNPQLDIFNITNADAVTTRTNALGGSYLLPVDILSPRIIRVGFSIDF